MKSNPPQSCCEKCKPLYFGNPEPPQCLSHGSCPCHQRECRRCKGGCSIGADGNGNGKCVCECHVCSRNEQHCNGLVCHSPQQEKPLKRFYNLLAVEAAKDFEKIDVSKITFVEHPKTEQEKLAPPINLSDRTRAFLTPGDMGTSYPKKEAWEEPIAHFIADLLGKLKAYDVPNERAVAICQQTEAFIRKVREQGIEVGRELEEKDQAKVDRAAFEAGILEGRRRVVEYIKEHIQYSNIADGRYLNVSETLKILEAASQELPDNKPI